MALHPQTVLAFVTLWALTGALGAGQVDVQAVVPLLLLVALLPTFQEAGLR